MSKIKIVLGVTVGGSSKLLEGQAEYLNSRDFDVYLMSPDHPKEKLFCQKEKCTHIPIEINRNISIFDDLRTLYNLTLKLRKLQPDIVNFGTPKMGFLGILAAKLSRVKNRIYTCRGLRYETERGIKRKILMFIERLSAKFATKVIYVSQSLMQKAIEDKVGFKYKSVVLANGSSNGLNLNVFSRENVDKRERENLINKYHLSEKFVLGFIGRITEDKGINDLIDSFEEISKKHNDMTLILVGHFECNQTLKDRIDNNSNILCFPFTNNVPLFLSIFDIFILPSFREGFPNVPIQAAAMGLPVITTNATGCVDSVKHKFNGFIYQKKNVKELSKSILAYYDSEELRKTHSLNAIEWSKNFSNEIIWEEQISMYKNIIQ